MLKDCIRARGHKDNALSSGSPSTSSVAVSWDLLGGPPCSFVVIASFLDALNLQIKISRELPGGPVVRTPCSHCRGHRFNP